MTGAETTIPHRIPEWVWPAGLAVIATALYASTFDGDVDAGDSAESVAGIDSLGILHAPGYPAYVLLARLFATVVPIGDMAFRANLFSLVCAVAAVVVTYAVGRALGVPAAPAAVGGLVLATGTSFWFYATYAKFYALTTLLLAGTLYLVARWMDTGFVLYATAAGVLVGLAAGASYQVVALALPGIVIGIFFARHRPWAALAAGVGAAAVVTVALFAFVFVRAGQDPDVNWGQADSSERLVDLVAMRDFGIGPASLATGGGTGGDGSDPGAALAELVTDTPRTAVNYVGAVTREFSALIGLGALLGLIASVKRLRRAHAVMLVGIVGGNIAGAMVTVGIPSSDSFVSGVRYGGFLLAASLVVAIWTGVGAWVVGDRLRDLVRSRMPDAVKRKEREAVDRRTSRLVGAIGLVAALILVVPVVLAHHGPASHRGGAAADYAFDVFRSVPSNGIVFVGGAEDAFPLQYVQVVEDRRTDADVVVLTLLANEWYRTQIGDQLGVDLTDANTGPEAAAELFRATGRPVVFDTGASVLARETLALRPEGLVAQPVDGDAGMQPVDLDANEAVLGDDFGAPALTGVGTTWPYENIVRYYATAYLDIAAAYAEEGRFAEVRSLLEDVVRIDPTNPIANRNLEILEDELG